MGKLYLPTNHCVFASTLAAIRSRHPLNTCAVQYQSGRFEIGYGNRNDVAPQQQITPCQAEDLLRNDVMYVEAFIRLCVARRISDRCYQALVSLVYDTGPKSAGARSCLSLLHEDGEECLFAALPYGSEMSRFNASIGRAARFFEVERAGL